jgi:LmbE family N-acetylglucosaminyl deacetylase
MRTLVVAPHPDDEVLGVGGTLFRRKSEGAELAWLIISSISTAAGWDAKQVKERETEIENITSIFGFNSVYQLGFSTRELDKVPQLEIIGKVSNAFSDFQPEEIFVPHWTDVHSDHRLTFDAVASCVKWFRNPYVKRVLAYETLSETDFALTRDKKFDPNVFIDIEKYLDKKISAMKIYSSELSDFPFPRSVENIRALAKIRGSASGFNSAEAFELLRERS